MESEAARRGFPIVGRNVGVTLELLARSIGRGRVFELGSGFGYSAYWFARAVGPEGEVHCTDGDPANEMKAADYLTRTGLWDRVSYHVGDAVEALNDTGGLFDLIYDDIDKDGYPDAWRAARERVRVGRPLRLRQRAVVGPRAGRRRAARRGDRRHPRAQRPHRRGSTASSPASCPSATASWWPCGSAESGGGRSAVDCAPSDGRLGARRAPTGAID